VIFLSLDAKIKWLQVLFKCQNEGAMQKKKKKKKENK
jgi:hypothetical protein